jgi:hypothetical protein
MIAFFHKGKPGKLGQLGVLKAIMCCGKGVQRKETSQTTKENNVSE